MPVNFFHDGVHLPEWMILLCSGYCFRIFRVSEWRRKESFKIVEFNSTSVVLYISTSGQFGFETGVTHTKTHKKFTILDSCWHLKESLRVFFFFFERLKNKNIWSVIVLLAESLSPIVNDFKDHFFFLSLFLKKQNKKESNLLQILSHQPNKLATKIWVIINTPSQSCCATLSSASHKFSQLLYNNRPEKIINKKKSPPSLYLSLLTPKLSVSVSLNYKKVKNKKKLKKKTKNKKTNFKILRKTISDCRFFFLSFWKIPTITNVSGNIHQHPPPTTTRSKCFLFPFGLF